MATWSFRAATWSGVNPSSLGTVSRRMPASCLPPGATRSSWSTSSARLVAVAVAVAEDPPGVAPAGAVGVALEAGPAAGVSNLLSNRCTANKIPFRHANCNALNPRRLVRIGSIAGCSSNNSNTSWHFSLPPVASAHVREKASLHLFHAGPHYQDDIQKYIHIWIRN